MKTKNVLALAVLSFLVSGAAVAAEKNGVYVGADIAFSNETELEAGGYSVDESNDVGFNAVLGYESKLEESFKLAGEVEYRSFGEVDFSTMGKMDGEAVFVNLKPSYLFGDGAYVAGVIGLGEMTLKNKESNREDSESGYQFGVEGGYQINDELSLNIGYRSANTEVNDVKVKISGFYAGARFYF